MLPVQRDQNGRFIKISPWEKQKRIFFWIIIIICCCSLVPWLFVGLRIEAFTRGVNFIEHNIKFPPCNCTSVQATPKFLYIVIHFN